MPLMLVPLMQAALQIADATRTDVHNVLEMVKHKYIDRTGLTRVEIDTCIRRIDEALELDDMGLEPSL